MRSNLRIFCLLAIAVLTWSTTGQAQQQPADEQRKLQGVVDLLERFAVRRILEAIEVDASQVASFRRVSDREPETWSVSGTAEITDLTGKRAPQPYRARLDILCDTFEQNDCWDLRSLTVGEHTFSGTSSTVVTLAQVGGGAAPERAALTGSQAVAVAGLAQGADARDGPGTGGGTGGAPDTASLLAMAEEGDPDAQYQLAEQYRVGFPVEQNPARALELYSQSAAQGDPEAQYRLGELYEDGEIVERDLAKAVEAYREAAEQGHPGAQYALAHLYHLGSGVEQDMDAAIAWYRKAALQGDEWSQLALGDQYRIGLAVPRDLEQSAKWYRRAADQGNIFAQYELANAYRYGNGVAQDTEQAMTWYRRSAEAGNPTAQLALNELEAGGGAVAAPPPRPADDEALQSALAEVAEEKAVAAPGEPEAAGAGAPAGEELALVTPPPSLGEQDLIDQLLARADDQMARLALTTPAGDNAYETYQEILSARPDNAAALEGVQRIGAKYVELAERAAARGTSERAHRYLDKALALAPDDPKIQAAAAALSAQESTAEASPQAAAGVAVPVTAPDTAPDTPPDTAPDPTGEAPADAADIAVAALPETPGVSGAAGAAASPSAAGAGETIPPPRAEAPKPDLLTSGLLFAVSGLDAHQAGRYQEAIEFYTRAIQAGDLPDRSLAYVYNNRGASYRNLNRFNQAIEDYDAAIRLNPDYATAFYNRGIAYGRKGFYSLAIDDFDTAIRLNPDLSDAYTQRGLAYVQDGRYDIAIENFSEAIRLDPRSDAAYFNRGLAYHSKGETGRAAEDIKKSYALNPDNPRYGEKMRELGIL